MYEENVKNKFLGEFFFKFKLIQERVALLMNQGKEAGKEYRSPSELLWFNAYVEGFNEAVCSDYQSKSYFKPDDNEASDPEPYEMHPNYCISIQDGFTRAIWRFTKKWAETHHDQYVKWLDIPKLAGKYITVHKWSIQCQPILNENGGKTIRSHIDNSITKTIRFNLFLVIHDFSILMDVPIDNNELKFWLSSTPEIKELEQIPMIKRALKEHLDKLQKIKNKSYRYFESGNTSKSAMQQNYDDLDEFLDSQQPNENLESIEEKSEDNKIETEQAEKPKSANSDAEMNDIADWIESDLVSSHTSSIDDLLNSKNPIQLKKRESKLNNKLIEEGMNKAQFINFAKWCEKSD